MDKQKYYNMIYALVYHPMALDKVRRSIEQLKPVQLPDTFEAWGDFQDMVEKQKDYADKRRALLQSEEALREEHNEAIDKFIAEIPKGVWAVSESGEWAAMVAMRPAKYGSQVEHVVVMRYYPDNMPTHQEVEARLQKKHYSEF